MVAEGQLLPHVAAALGVPVRAFSKARVADPLFAQELSVAERDGADVMAAKALARSKRRTGDVQRDRLAVDTIFRYLSKKHPREWGDRMDLNVTGGLSLKADLDEGRERIGATSQLLGNVAARAIIDLKRNGDEYTPDATSVGRPAAPTEPEPAAADDPMGIYR